MDIASSRAYNASMAKINIGIDAEVHEELRQFCGDRMMKMGAVATHAIRQYIERERVEMGEGEARPVHVPATPQEAK